MTEQTEKTESQKYADLVEGRANVFINMAMSFAAEHPHQAVGLLTELLVTVVEKVIESNGSDPNQGIIVQGPNRGVTIHPKVEPVLIEKAEAAVDGVLEA